MKTLLSKWQTTEELKGYSKIRLLHNPFLKPFDIYLVRYEKGTEIPPHKDPIDGRCHYLLNIILIEAKKGGKIVSDFISYESPRVKIIRPERATHGVTRVVEGTQYVLSVLWTRD